VVLALLLAAPLLRASVASALVTRGDALLFAHDERAASKYALALAIDRDDLDAADRLVFAAFLSRNVSQVEIALRVADATLLRHPQDGTMFADRGLCLQFLRRYALASRDFLQAGKLTGSRLDRAIAAADLRRTRR
jgi:Flp pilus assembly protein TadD